MSHKTLEEIRSEKERAEARILKYLQDVIVSFENENGVTIISITPRMDTVDVSTMGDKKKRYIHNFYSVDLELDWEGTG